METVFVRAASHRARERLIRLLGYKPKCHFYWNRTAIGGFFPIPAEMLSQAREIPGITRARRPEDLRECWEL
jgi:hypothetical protein